MELKSRRIETRRHDTSQFIAQCQKEVFKIMYNADSIQDIKQNKLYLITKKLMLFFLY